VVLLRRFAVCVVVFMVSLSLEGFCLALYIYKFSVLSVRVNLFLNFFEIFFCYDLRAQGIPFPYCAGPGSLPLLPGPSFFCCACPTWCVVSWCHERRMIMWRKFKASFNSREHLRDYLLAILGAVLLASCVGLLLFAWFVL